jgi:hypothetical protein
MNRLDSPIETEALRDSLICLKCGAYERCRWAFVGLLWLAGPVLVLLGRVWLGRQWPACVLVGLAVMMIAYLEGRQLRRHWRQWQFARKVKAAAGQRYALASNKEIYDEFLELVERGEAGLRAIPVTDDAAEPWIQFPQARAVPGSSHEFRCGSVMLFCV